MPRSRCIATRKRKPPSPARRFSTKYYRQNRLTRETTRRDEAILTKPSHSGTPTKVAVGFRQLLPIASSLVLGANSSSPGRRSDEGSLRREGVRENADFIPMRRSLPLDAG